MPTPIARFRHLELSTVASRRRVDEANMQSGLGLKDCFGLPEWLLSFVSGAPNRGHRASGIAGEIGALRLNKPIPYEGYYFRILSRQGPNGDGGAKSYLHSGRMTGGFALIAWPAVFESTGIMTFIVGPDGDVYQKDFGAETARIAREMTTFDPDVAWSRVEMTNE